MHFPVENDQGALGLVLRRGGNPAIGRETREKLLDVGGRQIDRMAIAVKADVAPDPVDVGLLGPYAVVLDADARTHLIKQMGCAWRHDDRPIRKH